MSQGVGLASCLPKTRLASDLIGFDVKTMLESNTGQPSWGLMGMLERANLVGGVCKIHSLPNMGTTVEFSLPITSGEIHESNPSIAG